MYGKIFESIYEGTLYGRWEAIVTMQQLIVLADSEGLVDMTPMAIAARTSIPRDIIDKGLEILSSPDPYSRTPGNDGVRITLIDDHKPWGWLIVNHEKYSKIVKREDKREADRIRIAEKRKALKNNDVAKCRKVSHEVASVANVAHEDEDVAKKEDAKNTTAPSVPDDDFARFKKAYPERSGGQPWPRARKAINARFREDKSLTWQHLIDAAYRYRAYCDATDRTGTEFVLQAATFCGPDKRYQDPWNIPATKSERKQDKNIEAALQFLETASGD